jgi:N-methylhydantoinase A
MGAATRVGVDVGGTFTDLVAIEDGRLTTAKVRSEPEDQSRGVLAALAASGVPRERVAAVAHGTTVATNALLERRGARTALITTAGFRDVLEIGRQDRPSLYDLTAAAPPPLVPRELRFTVTERIGPEGVRVALEDAAVEEAATAVREAGVEAVAVCLLFSFADPSHEQRIRRVLEQAVPDAFVVSSSEVLPEFREYERFSTAVASAYLGPRLSRYLERLRERLDEAGLPRPVVMQSSGGIVDVSVASSAPSTCVLSGPAAGVVAAAYVGEASGYSDLLTFDMGGTSTDVGLVLGGSAQVTTESVVAGVPIRHPMVDIHTVSAGGGSIAWMDSGGVLRVGPRSAGAHPGPACYGQGGTSVTVTDADLYLGYLDEAAELGDGLVLDRGLAEAALGVLAEELGLDPLAAALGVIAVAEAEMARALRVITVERGIDPRELSLVAFGGAGGVHACALAEELGMTRILFPRAAGVLSALGLAVSDLRRDYVVSARRSAQSLSSADLDSAFAPLEQRARADVTDAELERLADARYAGQSFELTVRIPDTGDIAKAFHRAHEQRYGYRMPDLEVELVALRLTARAAVPKPRLQATAPGGRRNERRPAYFSGSWLDTSLHSTDALARGARVEGPAVVSLPEATCVVRPGWRASGDHAGALILERT